MSSYQYKIYYPAQYQEQPDKKWPLILFLHGAGERGNNLELLKRQGLPAYLEGKEDFPFVVAYPQCPARAYWQVPLLNEWLEEVLTKVRADESRIYLTGISMGGYGTWHWAAANPDKFAAALPICGGGDPKQADKLTHLPIWAFHGVKDDIVPVEETLDMVEAVRALGGNVKQTIYPNLYHDSWTATYNDPEVYDWLLQHQKKEQ
ncbi:dienelactone hydrolase family protein [Pontibacter ummariensis]|uniref:Dienelactone hydrolase family protein n=1 Tax=Pontibacter ummariensis TaxID=1610492 RepID=A0A239IKG9_9BACT|nr:prolyl oligopeptidase family serine peptidase [Pontibacter ummariensis]PRY09878.1 dienelactone hydrolase family protein [Pontibacter ummariensis]SNS93728.1 Dienelactone hydrolase family protein [Pontibacter ummariensis]